MTAEDELESTAQRYLSACLQLNRPPNMCAVFGGSPEAVTAAHNCTMKVGVVGGEWGVRGGIRWRQGQR